MQRLREKPFEIENWLFLKSILDKKMFDNFPEIAELAN